MWTGVYLRIPTQVNPLWAPEPGSGSVLNVGINQSEVYWERGRLDRNEREAPAVPVESLLMTSN